jgi:hypothetical protein
MFSGYLIHLVRKSARLFICALLLTTFIACKPHSSMRSDNQPSDGEVGEVVARGKYIMRVIEFGRTRHFFGQDRRTATNGYTYLIVTIELIALSQYGSQTYTADEFTIRDLDGYIYQPDTSQRMVATVPEAWTAKPEMPVTVTIVYEIPETAEGLMLEYKDFPISNGITVHINLD